MMASKREVHFRILSPSSRLMSRSPISWRKSRTASWIGRTPKERRRAATTSVAPPSAASCAVVTADLTSLYGCRSGSICARSLGPHRYLSSFFVPMTYKVTRSSKASRVLGSSFHFGTTEVSCCVIVITSHWIPSAPLPMLELCSSKCPWIKILQW